MTAKYVGGGAVVGTILGALLGGGKGAVLGALAGGGAQVYTGKKKGIPAETQLTYKLAQPLTLRSVASAATRIAEETSELGFGEVTPVFPFRV